MIFNTTFRTNRIAKEIKAIVGSSISIFKRLKMGGNGSRRMIIEETSAQIKPYLSADHYITYSSIEIRTEGIIVNINQGSKTFSWPIPFYKLSIYYTKNITIHADGMFIRYRKTDDEVHYSFIKKILNEQVNYNKPIF